MTQIPMGRVIQSAARRRITDVAASDPAPSSVDDSTVAPAVGEVRAYELQLQSIAYGILVTAFYYESIDLFPMLKTWLQLHGCTSVTQDGPYVTFRQVRDSDIVESRVEAGGYCLVVPSGPLNGSVQPGKAEEVARLYRLIGQTTFSGRRIDDPEQLLLQASDETIRRVLRRLIAAEALLMRAGHEEWCEQAPEVADSCTCGHIAFVAAWVEASGADPARLLSCWRRDASTSNG